MKIPMKLLIILTVVSLLSCTSKPYQNKNLDIDKRVDEIISRMTLEEKIDYIGGYENFNIMPVERFNIPMIRMADGPVGVRNYGKSTSYPGSIALAASWNVELANKVGASIAKEAKAKNVHIMLGPAMNIHRAPMCGRNFEYLGEDPFLAGEIASNYIIGMQDEGVMATAKHYAANYQDFARHTVSSDMDERTLREIYLPAFEACVKKGKVASVMTAYNLVNGIHCSQHPFLNNDILKEEWGFEGFIMSDWTSTYESVGAANGGLDIEMPYGKYMNRDSLLPAIKDGRVTESTIDDKVRRILRTIMKFGYYDNPDLFAGYEADKEECSKIALEAAREGIVLLKNSGILPLDKAMLKTVAVLGPNADPAVTGGGGSSYVDALDPVSVKEGIENLIGQDVTVLHSAGPFQQVPKNFFQVNNNFYTMSEKGMLKGLKADIFKTMNLENEPAFTRIDSIIDFSFDNYIAEDIPCQKVSVRWTGIIKVEQSGKYRFILSGDDGYRFYLNDKMLINEWHDQAEKTSSEIAWLEEGKENSVKIEYFQNGGSASFRFGYEKYNEKPSDDAFAFAKKADVVIAVIGFDKNTESEGFDRTFELPAKQEEFLNKILDLNENTIVVLNSGGNVDMQKWLYRVKALVHAWYPGQEGGKAVAEILFGITNPSGKLPVTFEKQLTDNPTYSSYFDNDGDKKVYFSEGIYMGYRHYDIKNAEPLFPFGYGLSYTTFEYPRMDIVKNGDSAFTVKVTIKNTGEIYGKEIIQVYVSDMECSTHRPVKELKGFGKIGLNPGEEGIVEVLLDERAFSFFSEKEKKWVIEPGEFEIHIGASSRDIRFTKKVEL
ncbi:MAG: glycoside hydrolase family 3 C-terminal domain-containing protein [Bacteroidales bacterium]|nr:glycoside hydrolase family 3 C-terminal domain-containing protein [Bacteroidales bacterium]